MNANGKPVPQPSDDRAAADTLADVLSLVDEVVAEITPVEVEARLRRLLEATSVGVDARPTPTVIQPTAGERSRRTRIRSRPLLAAVAAAAAVFMLLNTIVVLAPLALSDGTAARTSVRGEAAGGASGCPSVRGSPLPTPPSMPGVTFTPPPGWVWYRDDAGGFTVAVPAEFRFVKSDRLTCFTAAGGGGWVIAVEQLGQAVTEPSKFLAERERAFLDANQPARYQRIPMIVVDFDSSPDGWGSNQVSSRAVWQYTFNRTDGTRMRALAMAFLVVPGGLPPARPTGPPGRAYAIYWEAPDSDWIEDFNNLYLVTTASFIPVL